MRILIAIESEMLRKRILNILKGAPDTQLIVYSRQANPVNEFIKSFFAIITDTGQKQLKKKKELFEALKPHCPAPHVLAISRTESGGQLFDLLCIEATAAMLDSEINTCLLPVLMQLKNNASDRNMIISKRLLSVFGADKANLITEADYHLTFREKEILHAIVKGLTYKMAGYELNISPETVRGHVKNIYKKLMVNSQSQAVAMAIYQNLV